MKKFFSRKFIIQYQAYFVIIQLGSVNDANLVIYLKIWYFFLAFVCCRFGAIGFEFRLADAFD